MGSGNFSAMGAEGAGMGEMRVSKKIDLHILGTGINGIDQITRETEQVLRKSRIVLQLTGGLQRELRKINPNTEDLDSVYGSGDDRGVGYSRLIRRVMDELKRGPGVAMVTYGHPLFFDDVNNELVRKGRRAGYTVRVLPAISCLSTLAVDLEIDYGDGLQVYEATEVVLYRHRINPNIHTLLIQVGMYNFDGTPDMAPTFPGRFDSLRDYLLKYYSPSQKIKLAISDEGEGREIISSRLKRLDSHRQRMSISTTMYVPPL
jgi:uncharacterized protein YabN with tetrapyrrole methylase and pyrophosphatase domain